jgi:16S rRNA (guanine966-N2)-methyltransferase
MRVIAGEAKSLRLVCPKGAHIRPTTDAMREALFGSLGERVVGARFADLFAGCGSVGIEALSRGAEHCAFVEKHPRCVEAIRTNLANTRLHERATVVRGLVEREWRAVCEAHGPFDILFVDPPYDLAGFPEFGARLFAAWEGVAEDGLVVVQCRAMPADGPTRPAKVKRFGESELRYYER